MVRSGIVVSQPGHRPLSFWRFVVLSLMPERQNDTPPHWTTFVKIDVPARLFTANRLLQTEVKPMWHLLPRWAALAILVRALWL
jgi:hypothetical protein